MTLLIISWNGVFILAWSSVTRGISSSFVINISNTWSERRESYLNKLKEVMAVPFYLGSCPVLRVWADPPKQLSAPPTSLPHGKLISTVVLSTGCQEGTSYVQGIQQGYGPWFVHWITLYCSLHTHISRDFTGIFSYWHEESPLESPGTPRTRHLQPWGIHASELVSSWCSFWIYPKLQVPIH